MGNNDFLLEHLYCHSKWRPALERARHYLCFVSWSRLALLAEAKDVLNRTWVVGWLPTVTSKSTCQEWPNDLLRKVKFTRTCLDAIKKKLRRGILRNLLSMRSRFPYIFNWVDDPAFGPRHGQEISLLRNVQTGSQAHPFSYSMVKCSSFSRVKAAWAWGWQIRSI